MLRAMKIVVALVAFSVIEQCIASPAIHAVEPLPRATEEWCDPVLGCLTLDDTWYSDSRPINVLPASRASINVRFYFHCRDEPNADTDYIVSADDLTSLANSAFDPTKPLKFISHGFIETGKASWLKKMAASLIAYEDYNVMRVDWGDGSLPMYSQAAANARVVGLEIAHMIATLASTYGFKPEDAHCIGHSLGSHICGYAGEKTPGMGRITGLDPAGPYYTGTPTFVRLDQTDATFVDCIHTDANSILLLGYGTGQPMGHLDFFPNGGHDQPGCDPANIAIDMITEDMIESGKDIVACKHIRAIKFFQDTLTNANCPWVGHECHDYESFEAGSCYSCGEDNKRCSYMGLRADEYLFKDRINVQLFVDTTADEPFCEFHYEVSVLTAYPKEAESWVMGNLKIWLYGDTGQIIEGVMITDDHERIDHGQIKKNMFTSTQNVGHVIRIELEWNYNDKITNPGTYCAGLICNRSLYVLSVQISPMNHYPESDRLGYQVLGCSLDGSTTEIEDGSTKSFMPNADLCWPITKNLNL